jgi:hypothetical protein
VPDLVTTEIFFDGQQNVTAAQLNNIIGTATIQNSAITDKPSITTPAGTETLFASNSVNLRQISLSSLGAYVQSRQVVSPSGNRNFIINPTFSPYAMQNSQAAQTFTSAAPVYMGDLWKFSRDNTGTYVVQASVQNGMTLNGVNTNSQGEKSLRINCTTSGSVAAGTLVIAEYAVEGLDYQLFYQGGSNAHLWFSFWAQSTQADTFAVSLKNSANNRSFVVPFTISVANTPQFFQLDLGAPDTASNFVFDNTSGIRVTIVAASGSSFQTGTVGAWQAGGFLATTAISNTILAGTSRSLDIQRPQLEVAERPSAFDYPNIPSELTRTRRYVETSCGPFQVFPVASGSHSLAGSFTGASVGAIGGLLKFAVPKRTDNPTIAFASWAGTLTRVSTTVGRATTGTNALGSGVTDMNATEVTRIDDNGNPFAVGALYTCQFKATDYLI